MAGYGTTGNSRRGRGKHRSSNGFEAWGGYMEAKRQKLNDQYDRNLVSNENELGPRTDIFRSVTIHVDGYTKPTFDELKKIMKHHGGQYEHYMSKTRVTHIIATSLPDSKIKKDFKNCKVVKPEWITESVKAGRLLSYIPFQLFSGQSKTQQGMAAFSTFAMQRQTSTSATLSRIASMNGNSDNSFREDLSSCQPDLTTTNVQDNVENYDDIEIDNTPQSQNHDLDDSDSSDNEFGRLMAQTKKFGSTNSIEKFTSRKENRESCTTENNTIKMSTTAGHEDVNLDNYDMDTFLETSKGDNFSDLNVSSINKNGSIEAEEESERPIVSENVTDDTRNKQTKAVGNRGMALAGEQEFINEFYNNSRLHHLSTWKSEFKAYVNELQKQGREFVGRRKLREFVQTKARDLSDRGVIDVKTVGKPDKVIMHIDMDCFFVSVGLRKRPDLKGKPIAVTHSKGKGVNSQVPGSDPQYEFEQWKQRKLSKGKSNQSKGDQSTAEDSLKDSWNVVNKTPETFHSMSEIASCSYEARQAGVKNGMFMGKAKSLCPELVTIPYDFEGYNEVSRLLYDIVASYTHDIEAVSCDEMLVDCTDVLADTGAEPLDLASILREEIYQKTQCSASAGLGSNILQAKMATRKAKPNGQYYLHSRDVLDFMKIQSVKDIPGVGWSMSHRLQSMSVSTCGDLQNLTLGALQKEFGPKTGQSLYKYCRGQDDRQIKLEQERKSVSAEINYGIRFKNENDADKFLAELSEEVSNRLKKINMKGKTVTLKLMIRREDAPQETAKFMGHGLCNHVSKSSTLPLATDDSKIIAKECLTILRNQHLKVQDLRGIGIQLQRLEPAQVGTKSAKGPASILNFTVSKQDMPKPVPNLNTSISSTVVTQESSLVQSADSAILPTEKSSGGNILKDFLNKTKTQKSSKVLGSVPDKEAFSISKHISAEDDSMYQRNKVCSDKTQNIVEDITRRRNPLIMPPLPSLNLQKSPTMNGAQVTADVDRTPSRKPDSLGVPITPELSRHQTGTPTDYFPSPSQIDPEVLQELPADIRQQIETEMKSRRKNSTNRKPVEESINSVASSHNQPGCSHWSSQGDNEPETVQTVNQEAVSIEPLPSLSQLDESCFNALPEDIQREIKNAYGHQNNNVQNEKRNSPISKKPQTFVKLTSPGKTKSPGKGKKNSPTFKVPKGRPGKGKPKKLDFVSRKQPKIDAVVSSKKVTENEQVQVVEPVIILDEIMERDHVQTTASPVKNSGPSEESERIANDPKENVKIPVNLCGAVTIKEVRDLLKEWLQTSTDPEKDDEEMMTEYMTSLVLDRNLEQVDLVIKFLKRHIKKLDSSAWTSALNRILDSVQNVVKGIYGGQLKV